MPLYFCNPRENFEPILKGGVLSTTCWQRPGVIARAKNTVCKTSTKVHRRACSNRLLGALTGVADLVIESFFEQFVLLEESLEVFVGNRQLSL